MSQSSARGANLPLLLRLPDRSIRSSAFSTACGSSSVVFSANRAEGEKGAFDPALLDEMLAYMREFKETSAKQPIALENN